MGAKIQFKGAIFSNLWYVWFMFLTTIDDNSF